MTSEERLLNAQLIEETCHTATLIGSLCFIGIHLTSETNLTFKLSYACTILGMILIAKMAKSYQNGYFDGLRDNPAGLLDVTESLRQQVLALQAENHRLKEELEDEYALKRGMYY